MHVGQQRLYCFLTTDHVSSNHNADEAKKLSLRQTFVLTPAMKVAVDLSVEQPTTATYVIKLTNAHL
jgi:hypothetical protein